MRLRFNQPLLCAALVMFAAIPRVLGAFFLPNAFGDAYVYIRDIGAMTTKLRAGTLAITDLYGFWLPLYQFISAFVNIFIGNGFYSGKLVAAVFGVGVCLLVYQLTMQLTERRFAASLAFALIALNPLHIFYSASAMTDVPHAFFVLASLYLVLEGQWIFAASLAALAGLTRVDSWMFIALIPLIQFLKERRVSPIALTILLMPPLFWFWISWKATGNWLATFETRKHYLDWLLSVNPSLARFSVQHIFRDGGVLLSSTDPAVMATSFVGGWLGIKNMFDRARYDAETASRVLVTGVYFFAFLSFLTLAYVTHRQPIIFDRYGLILLSLGIPLMIWTFLEIARRKPQLKRRLLALIVLVCALNFSVQLVITIGFLNQYSVQRAVADYLRDHFRSDSNARIFCDEGTVQALSGIDADKFLTSTDAPKDREAFLKFLNQKDIEYLIVVETERSTPIHLFPWSEYNEGIGDYESIMSERARFIRTTIHVYRRKSANVSLVLSRF